MVCTLRPGVPCHPHPGPINVLQLCCVVMGLPCKAVYSSLLCVFAHMICDIHHWAAVKDGDSRPPQ